MKRNPGRWPLDFAFRGRKVRAELALNRQCRDRTEQRLRYSSQQLCCGEAVSANFYFLLRNSRKWLVNAEKTQVELRISGLASQARLEFVPPKRRSLTRIEVSQLFSGLSQV